MGEETMNDGQGEEQFSTGEDPEENDGGRMSCQLYSYQVLEAATCHFSSKNKLGSGGFGTVYKVLLPTSSYILLPRPQIVCSYVSPSGDRV